MAALAFEHTFVVQAAVLNVLVGCKPVQQVVAAFLTYLQMIAIRDVVSSSTVHKEETK